MKITISVPEIDYTPNGRHPDDDEPECTMCHEPIYAIAAKLPGIRGRIHADSAPCLQLAVAHIEAWDPLASWLAIAEAVARSPHRHSAATIRATIQNLAKAAALH